MKSINCTITPTSKGKNPNVNILLEGELTLGNTQKIAQELKMAVSKYSSIQVEVKNVTNLDVTGVQLLFAISKTASEQKKQFYIHMDIPDEAKGILDHAGFGNLPTLLTNEN